MPRRVCGIPLGGLGVRDCSLAGECVKCNIDRARARRRVGGGGGTSVVVDALADAREDATMALERASSSILPNSSTVLELLLYDCPESETILGVVARRGCPVGTGFLVESVGRPVDRGGSFGFVSMGNVDDFRVLIEGWGLGA